MNVIRVNASRTYDVTVTDSWNGLLPTVKKVATGKKIAIITDENVAKLYLNEVCKLLSEYEIFIHTVPAGESSKCLAEYGKIIEELAENSFRRDDAVISLGGGVVGDLSAFVASTYMRGIKLIALPTTLLSMIDSSVGGKTAINLSVGKNLCGTFYQPFAVYINTATLATLPTREILCGKGELVKYAILDGRISAGDIDKYDTPEVISKCVSIKKEIVEQDEYDDGKRGLLNLGHTVGHAVEKLSEFTVPHGICVLKGLYAIADISKKIFNTSDNDYREVIALLEKVEVDGDLPFSAEEIIREIAVDKKSDKDGINLVLIKKVGDCVIYHSDRETVRRCLGA